MDTADLSGWKADRPPPARGRGVVRWRSASGSCSRSPATWASWLLRLGLAIPMAIPVTRIAASFFDAMRRRDALLASSTAIVLLVMALTLLYSLRSIDVDAAYAVTHSFSVDLTLAPDGKRMAYVANLDGRDQLFVVTLGKNDPAPARARANDDAPAWSPDGKAGSRLSPTSPGRSRSSPSTPTDQTSSRSRMTRRRPSIRRGRPTASGWRTASRSTSAARRIASRSSKSSWTARASGTSRATAAWRRSRPGPRTDCISIGGHRRQLKIFVVNADGTGEQNHQRRRSTDSRHGADGKPSRSRRINGRITDLRRDPSESGPAHHPGRAATALDPDTVRFFTNCGVG